jgi:hypothetical protein
MDFKAVTASPPIHEKAVCSGYQLRLLVQKLAVLRDVDITSVLPREELARPDLQNTAKAVDKDKYEHDAEWC